MYSFEDQFIVIHKLFNRMSYTYGVGGHYSNALVQHNNTCTFIIYFKR